MQRTHPTTWLLFACALLLAACAQLGLQAPQNLDDRIQYGRAGVTAAYRTLGDSVAAKSVTAAQATRAFATIESVEKDLALGEQLLRDGKPKDAEATVRLALNALLLIRTELAKKGAQP